MAASPYQVRSISPRELPIPTCIVEFYCATPCPPGNAFGCFELRNRGLELAYEVTCWPKGKHYALATGREKEVIGSEFKLKLHYNPLSTTQKRICDILQLEHWELAKWLLTWKPKVVSLHAYHQLLRLDDETGEIVSAKDKGWDCEKCGHMWLAKHKIARCPHCKSAWWWVKKDGHNILDAQPGCQA